MNTKLDNKMDTKLDNKMENEIDKDLNNLIETLKKDEDKSFVELSAEIEFNVNEDKYVMYKPTSEDHIMGLKSFSDEYLIGTFKDVINSYTNLQDMAIYKKLFSKMQDNKIIKSILSDNILKNDTKTSYLNIIINNGAIIDDYIFNIIMSWLSSFIPTSKKKGS